MDVFLFTITATAACCWYQFASSHSQTKKQQQQQRSSYETRSCMSSIIETKPLPHLVQDWIHEFPHLASSLLSTRTTDDDIHDNDTIHQPQPHQAQQSPRVIGLLIDTNSHHQHGRDHATTPPPPLSFLLEKAVAVVNHAQQQIDGSTGGGGIKIVYIANDWQVSSVNNENTNNNTNNTSSSSSSVDSSHLYNHHQHHYYKPVSFGLSAFTTIQTNDYSWTFQQFLQVCAMTVMEMIGMKNHKKNKNCDTTTTLQVIHSVTGKVMTKEGLDHVMNNNNNNNMNNTVVVDHHGAAAGHQSIHGNNNNNARAANPQDNWIEI